MNINLRKEGMGFQEFIHSPFLLLVILLVFFIIVLGAKYNTELSERNQNQFALDIIRDDFPSLICEGSKGGIRIYKENSYKLFHNLDDKYGWQIINTKTKKADFALTRCTRK